jgi:hypothetical protein
MRLGFMAKAINGPMIPMPKISIKEIEMNTINQGIKIRLLEGNIYRNFDRYLIIVYL